MILPHHTQYSKYVYVINHPNWLRFRYLLSLIAFLMTIIGNYYFLSSNIFISLTFGTLFVFLTTYFVMNYGIILTGYKKFDVERHNKIRNNYWAHNPEKSVDIFLPICGEDIDVLRNTWEGVKNLKYYTYQVYVLDDKGTDDYKNLAKEFGFNYLSRPNKGEMKKAGNLKYGFHNSKGDYITIFDADFRPHPDFLFELVPYMSNEKYGIIQSPQYFAYPESLHDENYVEYGAGVVQEDFYKIVQKARNKYNGAICVGSNALYRRSALELIGGTAQVEHSEDVRTGFRLWGEGYATHYVPLVLAAGLCPDNYIAFFKQQNRWCSGSMDLLRSKEFWKTKMPFMMRMCFVSGMTYYISQFVYFFLPLQIYLVLWINGDSASPWYILWFLPAILNGYFLFPNFRTARFKYGGRFVFTTQRYIFAFTVIYTLILGKTLGWTASGDKQKKDNAFSNLINFSLFYSAGLSILAGLSFYFGKIDLQRVNSWFTYYWVFFAIVSNGSWGILSKRLLYKERIKNSSSAAYHPGILTFNHFVDAITFAVILTVVGGLTFFVVSRYR